MKNQGTISAFSANSLHRRWCCCKPTAHCNISRDSVDLLETLRSVEGFAKRCSS